MVDRILSTNAMIKVQLINCVITNQISIEQLVFWHSYSNSQPCNNDPILIQITIAIIL
jgi:hypothetical protein